VSTAAEAQERRFNPERFSPVHVSVWMNAPRGFGRTLGIATAVGRSIRRDSTFAPLRHGKDVIGVFVGPTQAHAIQKLAGFSPTSGYWRRFMEECEQRNIAHRCGDGVITFFIEHLQNPCPNPPCGEELYADSQPHNRYQEYRQDGTNSTGQAVPAVPATVRVSGDAIRDEEGDAVTPSHKTDGTGVAVKYGQQESICTCGHGFTNHFIGGMCKRPACDCQEPRRIEQEDQDAVRMA
jgi:hypothetical protein